MKTTPCGADTRLPKNNVERISLYESLLNKAGITLNVYPSETRITVAQAEQLLKLCKDAGLKPEFDSEDGIDFYYLDTASWAEPYVFCLNYHYFMVEDAYDEIVASSNLAYIELILNYRKLRKSKNANT